MTIQFISGFMTALLIALLGGLLLLVKWKKKKDELIRYYSRYVKLIENSKESFYHLEVYPEIKFLYISPSAEEYFGGGSIGNVYDNPNIAFTDVHPDDYELLMKKVNGEMDYSKAIIQRWLDKDGNYRWFEEYATPIYENGRLIEIQGVMRNIDEKMELQQQLMHQLHHDFLTGLYNRQYFELIFAKYNEEINAQIGIILCDLDRLKYTNDNFGHSAGDDLIRQAANILNIFSSDTVIVARLRGDEFALVVVYHLEQEIKRLILAMQDEMYNYNRNRAQFPVSMSIGYSYSDSSLGKMSAIFSEADKKMYIEKRKSKATEDRAEKTI